MNGASVVDAQNPWLGLTSFTEETRQYFHGREEEGAELARRVQRKLLTVLFGQSGLGKTSVLQAGLVPRLRDDGFCPVYVRLDYHPGAPSPAEQIKRAVFAATQSAGQWTKAGAAVVGESLWEFLHHRDDVLKDGAGRVLIPIMIFDQFEEVFTLAQTDDAGRQRAREFLSDLADLVENRPPAVLEQRIDRDEVDAAQFDFARADYRIVISLREDYLANLEALKGEMPSVTQNRMRLARMNAAQAIAAVRGPAPQLVTEAVAAAIVRFVGGGAELAHVEVEPSLLSLICRELNNTRLAKGQSEISSDLLAGSRDTILQEFYQRAVGDQPAGVRAFVEDDLLTESGYRENIALERARKSLSARGADPAALDVLVNRRLLRVEERLDVRRVELMHDVLCGVVKSSRDVRREREAKLAVQQQLADTRAKEAATRQALVRARAIAAVAIVLMIVAAASAGFGFMSLRRARAADAKAQAARGLADDARLQSEKLISFLLEDFYDELASTGRVSVVAKLTDQTVLYYDSLRPELRTHDSEVYHGLALGRQAAVYHTEGNVAAAQRSASRARAIFEPMLAAGDRSDGVTVGEALALFSTTSPQTLGHELPDLEKAVALLRPVVSGGRASRGARLAFGDMLQYLGHGQKDSHAAIRFAEEGRQVLARMGALDFSDLTAASIYADVADSESRFYSRLGDDDQAEKLSHLVSEVADKVLAERPDDMRAMKDAYFAADEQGQVALSRNDLATAARLAAKAAGLARDYLRFNPGDAGGWQNLEVAIIEQGDVQFRLGNLSAFRAKLVETTKIQDDPRNRVGPSYFAYMADWQLLELDAQLDNLVGARRDLADMAAVQKAVWEDHTGDPELRALGVVNTAAAECAILAAEGRFEAIEARTADLQRRLAAVPAQGGGNQDIRNQVARGIAEARAEALLRLGKWDQFLQEPDYGTLPGSRFDDNGRLKLGIAEAQTDRAVALLRLSRRADAAKSLKAAEAYFRGGWAHSNRETEFCISYARWLETDAEAAPNAADRPALRREAAAVLGALTAEARQLRRARDVAKTIASE